MWPGCQECFPTVIISFISYGSEELNAPPAIVMH